MSVRYAVSLVLNAHLPYVREYTAPPRNLALLSNGQPLPEQSSAEEQPLGEEPPEEINPTPGSVEESWFFETLSETYLPLLMMFDRLEADHVPFRLGLSLSPVFAQMLGDELLLKKYAAYLDNQIDFGRQEIERLDRENVPQNGDPSSGNLRRLAQRYFDQAIDRRAAFTTRYEGSIFKAFDYYQRKRKIEFLAAPATHAFLPFLCPFPEAVQAQIETALSFYRYALSINPQGFWLPELGWSKDIDPFLRSYGFNYTIADTHGFALGNPPPSRGCFFPIRTPHGIFVLSRDFDACSGIAAMRQEGPYRDNSRDIGYELPAEMIGPFLAQNGARCQTGYKYWQSGDTPYNPQAAQAAAQDHARTFLENCFARLDSVLQHTTDLPLSLCAFNADSFGRHWHEGPLFLENLFRFAENYRELQFMTPSEYLYHQQISALEVSLPEFSSWGDNGYAETWLDSSNDWIYRHLNRSIDRMIEMADRFSRNSSLKERALNQAAREILLAMASDWPALLYRQECTDYARRQVEDSLHNFTTIYEALGSNYISTEWLTNLESRHDVFPNINYRVFKRKH
jgi:1,4-alpha-glucan branching enzyme